MTQALVTQTETQERSRHTTTIGLLWVVCYLEKTINSREHRSKAEALALDPQIIKGEDYRKFLKDNEQAT
jgi:hypothetical protein